MLLAVKLYKDVPNRPAHIPPHWPAEVREVPDGSEAPEGYALMTPETYEQYRRERWVETKLPQPIIAPEVPALTLPRLTFWQLLKAFLLRLVGR